MYTASATINYYYFARFSAPAFNDVMLVRPRLYRDLDKANSALICAPAGFGKTVLLSQYAQRWSGQVRWLSFTGIRHSPACSLALMVRAWTDGDLAAYPQLQAAREGLTDQASAVLEELTHYLTRQEQATLLIADAADVLQDEQLLVAFRQFVRVLPGGVRCLVAVRDDKHWAWTSLYMDRQVIRVGHDQLRWQADEFGSMESLQAAPVPEQLKSWFGDWPAALALWMKNADGWHDTCYARLSLLDYCFEERIQFLSEAARRLLQYKAPIECCYWNELAQHGGERTPLLVAELQRASLIERHVRDGHEFFVFPALVRDTVIRALSLGQPSTLLEIYIEAARARQDRGQLAAALDFATRAGDSGLITELLNECGWDLYYNGQHALIRRAIMLLDPLKEALAPDLLLLHLKILLLTDELNWPSRALGGWERMIRSITNHATAHFSAAERQSFDAGLACTRAQRALSLGKIAEARLALVDASLAPVPKPLRPALYGVLAELAEDDGNLDLANEYWRSALSLAQDSGFLQEVLWYTHRLAETELHLTHFNRAYLLRLSALRRGEKHDMQQNFAFWCLLRGHIELLLHALKEDEAEQWLQRADAWFHHLDDMRLPFDILRATLARQRKDSALWRKQVAQLEHCNLAVDPYIRIRLESLLIDYWIDTKAAGMLGMWLEFLPPLASRGNTLTQYDGRNRLRALAFLQQWTTWDVLARLLHDHVEKLPLDRSLLEATCWECERGAPGAWVEALANAQQLALLRHLVFAHPQRRQALQAKVPDACLPANCPLADEAENLIINAREQRILQLLEGGVGNEGLANRLCLASGTVRNNISALYKKIGVKNRRQAIAWWQNYRRGTQ